MDTTNPDTTQPKLGQLRLLPGIQRLHSTASDERVSSVHCTLFGSSVHEVCFLL